jgi:hypothetical protein
MTHIVDSDGNIIVDWKTGDKEGDRVYLFKAYRDALKSIKEYCESPESNGQGVLNILDQWNIKELDIDDFPRISINYPKK